ncbi:ATP-binding protein [Variovorax sp. J31P207]|uniref:ATP-binding protein n=1 Tax=Variovorax sp. J31P207 TaxID=3053510 RepID=UPI002576D59D|nr:ATP-binding protein [Variovorax sp. J31P207]MDM0071696.1 ATP-binding protein [Variovorax sp. J31P207]
MALQAARLTTVKSLSGYDFTFQPGLDRHRVMALAGFEFIERRQCVHFLGPPDTEKSHLAIALGFEAVKAGKSVFFATLAELVPAITSLLIALRFSARLIVIQKAGPRLS